MNFNDFLRQYFPEDGSYFASYHAFCATVIDSLSDIIREVFRDQLVPERNIPEEANADRARSISEISLAITEEIAFISECNLPDEERDGGINILNELSRAVKEGNVSLIDALIFGYNYYVLYNKVVSESVGTLIQMIAEYEQIL
jgi:hypothetical protein